MAGTIPSTKDDQPLPTCYRCLHYPVCGLAKSIRAALINSEHIDIDGKRTPSGAKKVMQALAGCCTACTPIQ